MRWFVHAFVGFIPLSEIIEGRLTLGLTWFFWLIAIVIIGRLLVFKKKKPLSGNLWPTFIVLANYILMLTLCIFGAYLILSLSDLLPYNSIGLFYFLLLVVFLIAIGLRVWASKFPVNIWTTILSYIIVVMLIILSPLVSTKIAKFSVYSVLCTVSKIQGCENDNSLPEY